jgi:hypothetical protein
MVNPERFKGNAKIPSEDKEASGRVSKNIWRVQIVNESWAVRRHVLLPLGRK